MLSFRMIPTGKGSWTFYYNKKNNTKMFAVAADNDTKLWEIYEQGNLEPIYTAPLADKTLHWVCVDLLRIIGEKHY